MSSFQSVVVAKYSDMGSIAGILRHDGRLDGRSPENADPKRKKENIAFFGGKSIEGDLGTLRALLPRKFRKDAIKMTEIIVQAGHDSYDGWPEDKKMKYWDKVLSWLQKKFCPHQNLVQAVLHRDEHADHLHFCFVPLTLAIDKDGKPIFEPTGTQKITLSHDLILGRPFQLKALHTDLWLEVGKAFGLERAIHGSRARHQDLELFFRKLKQNAPKLMKELIETEAFRNSELVLVRALALHDKAHDQQVALLNKALAEKDTERAAAVAAAIDERDWRWHLEFDPLLERVKRFEDLLKRGDLDEILSEGQKLLQMERKGISR